MKYEIKSIPIKNLITEEGAHELASSPDMQPYMDLIMAEMQGCDTAPQLQAIRDLPLEKRYVWRVASALKWAFADCETLNVEVDHKTLSIDDRARLAELLKHRPLQLCLFLSGVVRGER